jgi:hypothetical protein
MAIVGSSHKRVMVCLAALLQPASVHQLTGILSRSLPVAYLALAILSFPALRNAAFASECRRGGSLGWAGQFQFHSVT